MTSPLTGQLPLPPGMGSEGRGVGAGMSRPTARVTALGGGHGLSASLAALRHVAGHLTAIVTVADDGGSSGTIRREMAVLPPGDLRMALAALCDDTDWGRTWAHVMQHRFRSTEVPADQATLDNHALGNLLIVALWELLGDPVDGLRWAGALLRAHGEVLPVSRVPLTIGGDVLSAGPDGRLRTRCVEGQVALAVAAFEGGHEPAAERSAESAVGASEVGAGYLGVEAPRGAGQPALRGPAGTQDAPRHLDAGLSMAGGSEVGGADGTDLDLDVDSIQQWTGQS